MSDRAALIAEYRAFRDSQGLAFDRTFLPRRKFDDIDVLHLAYIENEERVAKQSVSELDALQQRVATLERQLAKLPDAFGAALAAFVAEQGFMKYAGTFDADKEEGYPKGSVVAHAGASWVAITQTIKGAKPGRSPEWRMSAKGDGK
jgi:hypothetical protein